MIYTWNGDEFEFITDVLGVAPLGASAGAGEYFPVDHDETIQIPGRSLALTDDGRYEIRIVEELREVAFLDQIRLIAVDHPARIDVFTNDKFKAPPFPEFNPYMVPDDYQLKAYADIDLDGDLDGVLTQIAGPPLLLRNDQTTGHHWLRVRLEGRPPNRDAIGAWVELSAGGVTQRRQVMPTRSYLSQVERTLTFGLGTADRVDSLKVIWPDGSEQVVEVDEVDVLRVIE